MRKTSILVAVSLLVLGLMAGCGKTEPTGKSTPDSASKGLTRAEYIGMLGESFGLDNYVSAEQLIPDVPSSNQYYNFIQAGAEWDVIDKGRNLEPESAATLAFATETAVRAIGIDKLEASGATVDKSKLTDFYVSNIAALDTSDVNGSVSESIAEEIIKYAKVYRQNLVLPQKVDIEYKPGVKESNKTALLNADRVSGVLTNASEFAVGDIVYWDAKIDGISYAARITSIDGDRFTCEAVSPEEVYGNVSISGTFDGTITNIHTASEDVSYSSDLSSEMYNYGGMSFDDGFSYTVEPLANGVVSTDNGFKVSFDGESSRKNDDGSTTKAKAHGEFEIAITRSTITAEYEHESWKVWKPTKVWATVNLDTRVKASVEGSISRTIPLGSMDINVAGPIFVRLKLNANIGADGSISLSYVTENVFEAGWKKDSGFSKSFNSESRLDFEAKVTLTAEATLLADVRVGFLGISESVINAQATTGVVATAKADGDLLKTDEPMCLDILMFVPLRWAVNQEGCLITAINGNFKGKWTVWDSKSSPFKWHFHFEDGKRVDGDKCTRGNGKEVLSEEVDEEGKPLDEYKIFDFEPIEFDFIILDQYKLIVSPGETAEIAFAEIPEGYSKNDLVYTVENPAICSVSGGAVTGNEAGSTVVKIATQDGMFSVYIAITVNDDYSGNFEGL